MISVNPYASPQATDAPSRRIGQTFCGLQPRWISLDSFHKFYITEHALYVGWIGGQLYDKLSVRLVFSSLYLILVGAFVVEPLAQWVDNRRRRLEAEWDELIEDPPGFLAADGRNFRIVHDDVVSIDVSSRKCWWWTLGTNTGVLVFNLRNRAPMEVIVKDSRGLDSIVRDLVEAGYAVQRGR